MQRVMKTKNGHMLLNKTAWKKLVMIQPVKNVVIVQKKMVASIVYLWKVVVGNKLHNMLLIKKTSPNKHLKSLEIRQRNIFKSFGIIKLKQKMHLRKTKIYKLNLNLSVCATFWKQFYMLWNSVCKVKYHWI